MCKAKQPPPQPPPAPAPPPPAPSAEVAQADPQNVDNTASVADRARRRGRASLRIDRAVGGVGGGTGLNIAN